MSSRRGGRGRAVVLAATLTLLVVISGGSLPTARDVAVLASMAMPPVDAVSSHAAPRPAALPSAPLTLTRTLFPNYNDSAAGSFGATLQNWTAGQGTVVPSTGLFWLPEIAQGDAANSASLAAPIALYNLSSDRFVGVVPGVSNVSAVLFDATTGIVYAAEWSLSAVVRIDAQTGATVGIEIPVGVHPDALSLDPANGFLFVANEGSNNLTVINTTLASVVDQGVPVCKSPVGIALDASATALYVACSGAPTVTLVNASNPTETSTPITIIDGDTSGIAYDPISGLVGVTVSDSQYLTLINGSKGGVLSANTVVVGNDNAAITAIAGDGDFAVANETGSKVSIVETTSQPSSIVSTDEVPAQPTQLVDVNGSSQLLVWSAGSRSLTELNSSSGAATSESPPLGVSSGLLAYDPTASDLWLGAESSSFVQSLSPMSGKTDVAPVSLPSPPIGLAVIPNGAVIVAVNGAVDELNGSTGGTIATNAALPGMNGPITVDPYANLVWVGRPQTSEFVGLNASTLALEYTVTSLSPNATSPQSVAYDPVQGLVFFVQSNGRDLTSFNGSSGVISRSSIPVGSNDTSVVWSSEDGLLYVVGDSLVAVNASTQVTVGVGVTLPAHQGFSGTAWDSTRDLVYVSLTSPDGANGSLIAISGSSAPSSSEGFAQIPDGLEPTSLASVDLVGTGGPGSGFVASANLGSGTIGISGSSPEITGFEFTPDPVDVNGTTLGALSVSGGAGPDSIEYVGLPPGCPSAGTLTIECTPSSEGSYPVEAIVTDAFGDTVTRSVTLNVSSGLLVSTVLGASNLRYGDAGIAVPFNSTVTGGTRPFDYSWTFGDGSSASGANWSHVYGSVGSYPVSLTVSDETGAKVVSDYVVTVSPPPAVDPGTVGHGRTTDVGLPVDLVANATGGAGSDVALWSLPGGVHESGESISYTSHSSGTLELNVSYTDAIGEVATGSVTLLVNPALSGTFSANPTSGVATPGTPVDFSAAPSEGTPPYNVTWDLGDHSVAYGESISHDFSATGAYVVEVRLSDAAGGVAYDNLTVDVTNATGSVASPLSGNFGPGLLSGLIVGATGAAVVLFAVERSHRRRLPGPPSPYVPPSGPAGKRRP